MVESGLDVPVFLSTTLMDMYVKCGSLVDARQVFDNMPVCSVVSWNVLILGYAKKEEGALGLELYGQMQEKGVGANDRTYVGVLKACSSLATMEAGVEVDGKLVKVKCLARGRAIHSHVVKSGFESNMFVGSMLVDMYAKCGSMVDARQVFDRLPRRNVVSWTAMVLGYAENLDGERGLQLYARMQQEGIAPDDRSFVGALKACSSLTAVKEGMEVDGRFLKMRCLEKGRAIHSRVLRSSFEAIVYVGNALIDMYAKCGSMVDARRVFDDLPRTNVVSWTAMILGYAEHGESEEAFQLYVQMQEQGLSPNSWTFVSILKACSNAVALEAGKEIHAHICRVGPETMEIMVGTALVDMYCKCGSMIDAQRVFDALPTRDVVTWGALIAGYARQGESELVFHSFERMRQESVHPNRVTFLSVLTACSHAGLVAKGQEYFNAMHRDYGVAPTIEHYTCMVDLLGRAGRMEEAVEMVKKMPLQPNLVTWMTLLGACRKWTDVEVGRNAFECIVSLDETHAAAYVLMSNIYKDADMSHDSDKIQAIRVNARAWKKPGKSWWTQVGGMVHTFVAGDTNHPHSEDIYAKLKDLSVRIVAGYVPNPDCLFGDGDEEGTLPTSSTVTRGWQGSLQYIRNT